MNVLEAIMAERRADAQAAREALPVDELMPAVRRRKHRSIAGRLQAATGTCIIAEMKQASPSAGRLRDSYDPSALAAQYQQQGAVGISVLTEPRHFLGSEKHLRAARAACELPILRKDFTCEPYHVYEAAAWGADIVLLILAALEPLQVNELYAAAVECRLEVLAETHTATEIEQALELEGALIGVNSRDLKTLKTDLAVAHELAAVIPADRFSIAESGIRTRDDILGLQDKGYDGFLIGEALVRENDPGGKLGELLGRD